MFTHFYADPHFGHEKIAKLRGFDSAADMDRHLVSAYCGLADMFSVVCWVGDAFFCNKSEARRILLSLPGRKVLVRGNHDGSIGRCADLFDFVVERMHVNIDGKKVLVCHYPPMGSTSDPRYPDRRPVLARDEWLVHGHTHEQTMGHGKRIHVGVDATPNFSPLSMLAIEEEITRRAAAQQPECMDD